MDSCKENTILYSHFRFEFTEAMEEFQEEIILVTLNKSYKRIWIKFLLSFRFHVKELRTLARPQLLHPEITVSAHLENISIQFPL